MKYNLDEIVDRTKHSKKWNPEFFKDFFKPTEDILSLWVADMDFKTPKPILDEMQKLIDHGILGYEGITDDVYDAIISWNKRRKNYEVSREMIVFTHGVVSAINFAIQTFTKEGDGVLIQPPVYAPFRQAIRNNNRKTIKNTLINNNGHYEIDFEDFEQKIIKNNVKLFIFCSPHNPVGRVWTREEITKLAEICLRHDVIIVADEIHSDLVFDEFTSFMTKKEFYKNLITCTSTSKTFNVAGVQTATIFIPDEDLRNKFNETINKARLANPNIFGLRAIVGGYNNSQEWLEEVIAYLDNNRRFIKKYLDENIKNAKYVMPQGTYLAWIDLSEVIPEGKEIETWLEDDCRLALDYGYWFGSAGKGFVRLNFACPREILEKALERIKENQR